MNKAFGFMRLDLITVKPYLTYKNLLIFVGVALIMTVSNMSAGAAIGLLMAFFAIYAGYPFAIGEKSGIDALYVTLSIKRNTVVLGRYLFAVVLDICAGLFAFIFYFITLTITQNRFDCLEILSTILVLFLTFSAIQAIQLPIYFKLGYTKTKFLAYLPSIVLPVIILAFSNRFRDVFSVEQINGLLGWFASNFMATAFMGAAIWFAIMASSYKTSLSFYKKRDF